MTAPTMKGKRTPESDAAAQKRIRAVGEVLRDTLKGTKLSRLTARMASLDLTRTRKALVDYSQRLEKLETAYSLSTEHFAAELRKRHPELQNVDPDDFEQWRALIHMREQAQRRLEKLLAKGAA